MSLSTWLTLGVFIDLFQVFNTADHSALLKTGTATGGY